MMFARFPLILTESYCIIHNYKQIKMNIHNTSIKQSGNAMEIFNSSAPSKMRVHFMQII